MMLAESTAVSIQGDCAIYVVRKYLGKNGPRSSAHISTQLRGDWWVQVT